MQTTENGGALKLPPHYRGALFRMGAAKNRFICYAHRALAEAVFVPEIIDRYPRYNRPDFAFPEDIKMVFFPFTLVLLPQRPEVLS